MYSSRIFLQTFESIPGESWRLANQLGMGSKEIFRWLEWPLIRQVVAVAVGMVDGEARADLDYGEDLDCDVDLNLVYTGDGRLVEIQGTAEGEPFSRQALEAMLEVGWQGAEQVAAAQRAVVEPVLEGLGLALP